MADTIINNQTVVTVAAAAAADVPPRNDVPIDGHEYKVIEDHAGTVRVLRCVQCGRTLLQIYNAADGLIAFRDMGGNKTGGPLDRLADSVEKWVDVSLAEKRGTVALHVSGVQGKREA